MECLIVDDDQLICDLLDHFCSKVDLITSVTMTHSGFESINLINQNMFDLIFLDYNLPDITGREILDIIPEDTAVIVITSHLDFAAETYNYEQVIDFLPKPLDFDRFSKGLEKFGQFVEKQNKFPDKIFVKEGSKLVKIDFNEVLYFKAEANYISVIMPHKRVLILMPLKELNKKLPPYYQRVHRSYIVNINKIDAIEVGDVIINDTEIPVSNTYEKILLQKINLLS